MRSEEQIRRLLRATEMVYKVALWKGNENLLCYLHGQILVMKCILGDMPMPNSSDDELDRIEETLASEGVL